MVRRGVLFVCMGNICRSPLARVIFEDLATRRGLREGLLIESCGTGGWHAGEAADPRSVQVAAKYGLELTHSARQLARADFTRFDWLIAMDRENRAIMLHAGAPANKIRLMRSFDAALTSAAEHELDVPDPYYGGADGFETVYRMLVAASEGLMEAVLKTP